MPARPFLRRSLSVLVTLAAALGIAEVGLRWFQPHQVRAARRAQMDGGWTTKLYRASDIPGLEYELRPGGQVRLLDQQVTVNALGLRNHEVALKPAPGVVRIACLGDSFAFGHGVADDETIPVYLQDQLDRYGAPGARYEVLNFGVTGYSTRDEALLLRGRVLEFEPDVVLLLYCLNDPDLHPDTKLHDYFHAGAWYERSWVVQLVEALRRPAPSEYFHALHAPGSAGWRAVVRAFDDIAADLDAAGVAGMVAVLPLLDHARWPDYPYREEHARVRAAAQAAGLRSVDLLELLPRFVPAPQVIRLPDGHATSQGNRAFAALLKDQLSRWDSERFGAPWSE